MGKIEDLEEKLETENGAESAMVEGRGLMDVFEVARIATERLGTKELSVMLQGVMYDGVERDPQDVAERFDILLFRQMGKEEWIKRLDVIDRPFDVGGARLEVRDLCDAVASAASDIVSAQGRMAQAEEVLDETMHRLGDLLVRLRQAEKAVPETTTATRSVARSATGREMRPETDWARMDLMELRRIASVARDEIDEVKERVDIILEGMKEAEKEGDR